MTKRWLAGLIWHNSTKSYQWQWKCGCSLTSCPGHHSVWMQFNVMPRTHAVIASQRISALVLNKHYQTMLTDSSYQQFNSSNPSCLAEHSRTTLMRRISSASWTHYAILSQALDWLHAWILRLDAPAFAAPTAERQCVSNVLCWIFENGDASQP